MSMSTNGLACSYKSLSNYNGQSQGQMNSPPVPATTTSGVYIVPNYGSIGYSALTGNGAAPSCSGYFSITNGYGAGADNCNTTYSQKLCQ